MEIASFPFPRPKLLSSISGGGLRCYLVLGEYGLSRGIAVSPGHCCQSVLSTANLALCAMGWPVFCMAMESLFPIWFCNFLRKPLRSVKRIYGGPCRRNLSQAKWRARKVESPPMRIGCPVRPNIRIGQIWRHALGLMLFPVSTARWDRKVRFRSAD